MRHIAQINIARARAPMDSPIMAGFVAQLDEVNALADASPGFVWRLQGNDGQSATTLRPYDDPLILINMSVWESIEALHTFVYRSRHVGPLRARNDWFEKFPGPYYALWWVPAGHTPTMAEGVARLEHLREHGPSEHAFWFGAPPRPPRSMIET